MTSARTSDNHSSLRPQIPAARKQRGPEGLFHAPALRVVRRRSYQKGDKCADCGRPVSIACVSGYCSRCWQKHRGERDTKRRCVDCGTIIAAQSRRCRQCWKPAPRSGPDSPNWRGGRSLPGKCEVCGKPTSQRHHTRCRLCAHPRGADNPRYKSVVTANAGRVRAIRSFPIVGKVCEKCDNPAKVRHHRNDNTNDNGAENIAFLCYRHHAQEHIEARRAGIRRRFAERAKDESLIHRVVTTIEELSDREGADLADDFRRLEDVPCCRVDLQLSKRIGWTHSRLRGKTAIPPAEVDDIIEAITLIAEGKT